MTVKTPLPYPLDSLKTLELLRSLGEPVLLDSGQPDSLKRFGRFDILSAAPKLLVRYDETGLSIREGGLWRSQASDPFAYIETLLELLDHSDQQLPFTGGLIGHWSYDLGRVVEKLPTNAEADIDFPWMQVGLYLWAIVIDHQLKQSWLVSQPDCSKHLLKQLEKTLCNPLSKDPEDSESAFQLTSDWQSNMSREVYGEALDRIDQYIHAGDCYQINYSQRFSSQYTGDPWQGYKQLRKRAPTPFSAFIEYDKGTVLSFSPERFVEISEQGEVETRPIKGTRPRGATSTEDQALADELASAPKDRTENLMIVDLLRNDLSRACTPGSVKVPEIFAIESYPNVHHLVSSVTGKLASGQSPIRLLKSAFPGGSITGAPKVRAMEIIDELEPQRRSIYCGSIGYISATGRMDTSICIRTLICQQGQIHCWAGGGIVADSDTEDEYQETLNKVSNLLSALNKTTD